MGLEHPSRLLEQLCCRGQAKGNSVHSHCSCSLLALQTLQEEKERKSECLPPEPHPDDPESVKIIFKLPNDSRVERRFHFTQSLTVSLGQSSGAFQGKG